MAQSVNPFANRKTTAATPPPADPARQAAQAARAAGRPVIPPPAVGPLPPGVTGTPMLPTGRVTYGSLTPAEREALAAAGLSPDTALPQTQEGLKELREAVAASRAVEVPLPVDPRRPPLKVETVPLSSLPAEKQAAIAAVVAGITANEQAAAETARQTRTAVARETTTPGSSAAAAAAAQAMKTFRDKLDTVDLRPDPVLVNPAAVDAANLQAHFEAKAAAEAPRAAAPPPPPTPPAPPASETGAAAPMTECPHCQWSLASPDVVEPKYAEKMAFLQSMLGDKPFVQEAGLFGGQLVATFRTLTIGEMDVVYKQAYRDRNAGRLDSEIDFWEMVNRYRLMLQLQSVRGAGGKLLHDLPDAYSLAANPNGTATWVTAEQADAMAPDETGLPDIQTYLLDKVLKTETVFRIVNNACRQFNRLVSKLEAMADNSDFWQPTGEPS